MSKCPHCGESVTADELLEPSESGEGWTCFNCGESNWDESDECASCGLSRETSEYLDGEGGL